MTHYNVDYSGLTGQAKQDKAIEDVKGYLGTKQFVKVCNDPLVKTLTKEQFMFQCSMFVGISGYPAEAFADFLNLKSKEQ